MENEKSYQDILDEEFEKWFWAKVEATKHLTPTEKLDYWEEEDE